MRYLVHALYIAALVLTWSAQAQLVNGGGGSAGPSSVVTDLGTISSPTLSINVTTNRVFKMALATNVTSLSVTGSLSGSSYVAVLMEMTQAGSGAYTVNWPSNCRWQGGFSPSLSTSVGASDMVQLLSLDGTATWFCAISLQAAP